MANHSNSSPSRKGGIKRISVLRVISSSRGASGKRKNNQLGVLLWFLLIIGTLFVLRHLVLGDKTTVHIIIDEAGNKMLSPQRQAKLDRELEEIDNAEQYVLLASESQYYPCYHCSMGIKTVFLKAGEVWRYGVTRKGETGRYPNNNYGVPDVTFLPQFKGTYGECLKMEKLKIYNYPLLPEAQRRNIKLIRPPGNAYDH